MLIDATSCSGWDCNIEGQFCPKGVPGASAGNFLCKDKKWMQVDSRPASLALETDSLDVGASGEGAISVLTPVIVC